MRRPSPVGTVPVLLVLLAGCAGDAAGPEPSPATPTADPAAAEFVQLGAARSTEELTDAGFTLTALPEDAVLTGAGYAFVLDSVAVTDELDADELRAVNLHRAVAAPLRAGAGQEFLVVYLGEPDPGARAGGGDTAAVIVAGQARPLPAVPHEHQVIVVSVPAGEDATLAVTDAGETQAISLRTGRPVLDTDRTADALQAGSVELEDGVQIEGVTPPDRYDGLTIRITLRPYSHDDERGWAESGHMWLEVGFGLTAASLVTDQAALRLDLAESLTIQGSDGTALPIPAGTVLEPAAPFAGSGLSHAEWSSVYDVPDTLRTFEVSYATQGTFTAESGSPLAFTRVEVTSSGTVELTER
jgi:hypothetical protein